MSRVPYLDLQHGPVDLWDCDVFLFPELQSVIAGVYGLHTRTPMEGIWEDKVNIIIWNQKTCNRKEKKQQTKETSKFKLGSLRERGHHWGPWDSLGHTSDIRIIPDSKGDTGMNLIHPFPSFLFNYDPVNVFFQEQWPSRTFLSWETTLSLFSGVSFMFPNNPEKWFGHYWADISGHFQRLRFGL